MDLFPASLDADEDERELYDDSELDDSHERDDDSYEEGDNDDSSDASGSTQQEVHSGNGGESLETLQARYADLQRRFAGQSRRINQDYQARSAMERQHQAEREQLLEALLMERIQDLPHDEQQAKIAEFRWALEQERRTNEYAQEREVLVGAVRQAAIIDIANRYGVSQEELAELPDADTMEWFAVRESRRRKKEQQSQKRNSQRGKGRGDSSRQTSAPPREPKTLDDAENEFMRLARRRR